LVELDTEDTTFFSDASVLIKYETFQSTYPFEIGMDMASGIVEEPVRVLLENEVSESF
jgi:hypothetical protein